MKKRLLLTLLISLTPLAQAGVDDMLAHQWREDVGYFQAICSYARFDWVEPENFKEGKVCDNSRDLYEIKNVHSIRQGQNNTVNLVCMDGSQREGVQFEALYSETACANAGPQILDIAVGLKHSAICARTNLGVRCWNGYDVKPPHMVNPRQIFTAYEDLCALDDQGLRCWEYSTGYNTYSWKERIDLPEFSNPSTFGVGGNTCVATDDGVKCWLNGSGRYELVPPLLAQPSQISVGYDHACALTSEGVKCWGDSSLGQTVVPRLFEVRKLTSGWNHNCVLEQDGVFCWGSNEYGQIAVPPLVNPTDVATGLETSCAVDEEGLKCWGWNVFPEIAKPHRVFMNSSSTDLCTISDEEGLRCFEGGWQTRRVWETYVPRSLRK